MGILDIFSRKEHVLTLDAAALEQWPGRLLRRQGLDKTMDTFMKRLTRRREELAELKEELEKNRLRDRFPERASTIYEEHMPSLTFAVNELSKEEFINDIFLIEEQQQGFREAITNYHEQTGKSISALKEFLTPELQMLSDGVKALEDTVINLNPVLDEKGFAEIKAIRELIEEYKETRPQEKEKLTNKKRLLGEIDFLEGKRRKIKGKIQYYMDRAKNSTFKGLIAEEGQLLEELEMAKEAQEDANVTRLQQRLASIRREMIHDVTAMNINEQRSFLGAVKQDLQTRKEGLATLEEDLQRLHYDAYRSKFSELLAPFNARIEDVSTIIEDEEEDVAPQ